MNNGQDVLDIARSYRARGWWSVPVPYRQKGPVIDAWQNLRIDDPDLPKYFRGRSNIGILTGEPSGWLIDVDLDHPLAVELAPQILPKTSCIFGREGKPRSHYLYCASGAVTHKRTTGKVAGMLVELRATGLQTIFPGSVHETGEPIEWAEDGGPAVIDPVVLQAAVDALADEVERRLGLRDELDEDAELPDTSEWSTDDQGDGLEPGADFNQRGDAREVLRRHGWIFVRKEKDGVDRWRRPGKASGISASLKDRAFYCFTSSTAIPCSVETKRGYSPFAVLAYLEHGGDFSAAAKALAAQGYGDQLKAKAAKKLILPEPFVPFPTATLPLPLRNFVGEAAKAIGCDETLVALPLLAALAGCIGSSRRLRIKKGWFAPAVLWTAAVVDSGQQKSPAQGAVMRLLYERQGRDLDEHANQLVEFQRTLATYERDLAGWKKKRGDKGDPPEKPEEPVCKRILVSDPTIEAVADRLQDNQRGLLLDRDELSGWLGSYDQYRSGKGSDVSHWLSAYNAKPWLIDRKTSDRKTIYAERAAVSVTGGIQPRILARLLGKQHFENGLAARFGFGMPPKTTKRWSEANISGDAEEALDWVYDVLLGLKFRTNLEGKYIPVDISFAADGKEAFVAFYNEHGKEQAELTGDLAALWAKLEEVAARIALVMHLVRCSIEDQTLATHDAVDATSVATGVALARWFGNEGRRIYGVLSETDEERDRRLLIERIQGKGGRISIRDLCRSSRRYASASLAEAVLNELVQAGAGRWEVFPPPIGGGSASREMVLLGDGRADTRPSGPEESKASVSVGASQPPDCELDEEDDTEETEWTL